MLKAVMFTLLTYTY